MRTLLDTQLYLWFLADSPKLSKKARGFIGESEAVFVSSASIWEAAIKIGLKRLAVSIEDVIQGIEGSGFLELPITARQSALVAELPLHHRDPFDRLLIAQAMYEPLRLLTVDTALEPYSDLVTLV
ncbi:MAG: type II toxin-antitoxin system VapC family toxin [Nitrospirota bacterium]|nr:type II toxin-antitoxin system VapC family toxin [Nitrospirota bacterium]MDH5775368.1 type II toxin-antitoxin system VapC family toxin [Nitrospirota bacterium]